jgi:WD40 repeat protein
LHNDQRLEGASFDPSGRQLVSNSPTGITVWEAATARPVGATIRVPGRGVYGMFDPADAVDLYTVSDLGDVVRWDRHDPAHPKPIGAPFRFPPQTDLQTPPVIASDRLGRWLAVAPTNGSDSTTAVWDTRRHVLVRTITGAPLAFLADGSTIAIRIGTGLELRDVRTGALVGRLPHGPAQVTPASASSLDGRFLAVLNDNDTIDVYDLATRAQIAAPLTVPGFALPSAILPDGRLVVSTATDVSIWRVGATVAVPGAVLQDHVVTDPSSNGPRPGGVTVTFLGDGRRLLTQRWSDGREILWDATTHRPLGVVAGGRNIDDVQRSGRVAAVFLSGGDIGLWDLASERQVAAIHPDLGPDPPGAFSQDGSLLALTAGRSGDNSVELWDVTRPASPVLRRRMAVPGHTDAPLEWFSADDRSLMVVDYSSSTITAFDVASGRVRWTHTLTSGLWQVGTSPDSRLLFAAVRGFSDNGVRFIDMRNGRQLGLLSVPDVFGVTYADHGHILAVNAGSGAGMLHLYDASTLTPIGVPLRTPGAGALLLATSADGNTVGAGTDGGYAVLWDVDVNHWEAMACQIAGRNLTQAEWHEYLPDLPYQVTCSQWPSES